MKGGQKMAPRRYWGKGENEYVAMAMGITTGDTCQWIGTPTNVHLVFCMAGYFYWNAFPLSKWIEMGLRKVA